MRIAYFIHGRGRGHAARAQSLIPNLKAQGWDIDVFAGGAAYEALKDIDGVNFIESVMPDSSLSLFPKRIFRDFRKLKRIKPDLLIADGDAPCTYAAKLLGIRVMVIGHALIFPYCHHEVDLPRAGLKKEMFKVKVATQMADFRIAVHFTPIQPINDETYVVRPDFSIDGNELSNEGFLLSYFRDGNGIDLIHKLVEVGFKIKNFGQAIHLEGVDNFEPDNKRFHEEMKKAAGVVGSAGSNLIFESMAMQKPLFLLYKKEDFEQAANVKYVEKENAGVGSNSENLDLDKVNSFLQLMDQTKKNTNSIGVIPQLSDIVVEIVKRKFNFRG